MILFRQIFAGINRILKKQKVVDTGMRTDRQGNIFVDNKVFFKRKEVREKIEKANKKKE